MVQIYYFRRIICFSMFLVLQAIYLIFKSSDISSNNIDFKVVRKFTELNNTHNKTVPLIVFCTDFYDSKFLNKNIRKIFSNCNFQCQVTDNFSLYPKADVAVFHARNMVMKDVMFLNKNFNRLNVFYSIEAFPHEKFRRKRFPKNFFNVTMSFRRDSNIWTPYDWFEQINPHEKNNKTLVWSENEINQELLKKTELAVEFVSHCNTHSLREKYVERLQEYVNISTYGWCVNKTFVNEDKLIEKHFFYLAFENAVCKDYITEKFWRIKQLIVPVVLKRSLLKGIVEDDYFIAADDFNSTKALVDRLVYLSKNMTEYKKYFKWTSKYKKTLSKDDHEFCKLCEMAVKREKHYIKNIYDWWETESDCHFNYINAIQNF